MSQDIVSLKIVDICGSHCVGLEDGKLLYDQILPILKSGSKVCLDFDGILTLTSSFLNASVGRLFGQNLGIEIEKQVVWNGLDEDDVQLIQLVIRNAKEHFSKHENDRQAINNIVQNVLEED